MRQRQTLKQICITLHYNKNDNQNTPTSVRCNSYDKLALKMFGWKLKLTVMKNKCEFYTKFQNIPPRSLVATLLCCCSLDLPDSDEEIKKNSIQ